MNILQKEKLNSSPACSPLLYKLIHTKSMVDICFLISLLNKLHSFHSFSFLKLVTIESHFRDKDYSNTFILQDTKSNVFTNHVPNQGTSSTLPFIKFATIQTNISFTRQGSFEYFLFTKFKTKQVQISCFASRVIERQIHRSYLSNF